MKKIKNNLLIKNIIILLLTGAASKILGMIGKVIYTRTAGINVVSLYTIITPTLMLIISITQFSFPISLSKLSAEEKYKNNDLLKNAYILGFIINIILIISILCFSNTIATMLHNKSLGIAIKSTTLILPFVTISSIQRGFLHGKENMMPSSISNIVEEVVKVLLIITLLPIAILKSNITAVILIILFNIITETCSIVIMNNTINKNYKTNEKGRINKQIIKDIYDISLPTTSVRLIASIGFFLEPIILTNILLKTGYSSTYITLEYGIINSYVMPLLAVPSFFSISIASALLPNITKAYANKKYNEFNNKLLYLLILSIGVGIISLSLIMIFPSEILSLIYGIDIGINYIYLIGPFFLIVYMQPTLSAALQSMNKTKKLFKISLVSTISKYIILIITGLFGFGINSLIYSMITGIIVTTTGEIFIILKNINKRP